MRVIPMYMYAGYIEFVNIHSQLLIRTESIRDVVSQVDLQISYIQALSQYFPKKTWAHCFSVSSCNDCPSG